MERKQDYTPEFRAESVKLVLNQGLSLAEAAKRLSLQKMRYLGALRYMLPWLPDDLDELDKVFGGDPWPYGVEPNRPASTSQPVCGRLANTTIPGDVFVSATASSMDSLSSTIEQPRLAQLSSNCSPRSSRKCDQC